MRVVWFEVDLIAQEDMEAALAFSWEDFIGLFNDQKSLESFDNGQLLSEGRANINNGENWPLREKAKTYVEPYQMGSLKGLIQYAADSLQPHKLTFQNYVNQVVIAVEEEKECILSSNLSFGILKHGISLEIMENSLLH